MKIIRFTYFIFYILIEKFIYCLFTDNLEKFKNGDSVNFLSFKDSISNIKSHNSGINPTISRQILIKTLAPVIIKRKLRRFKPIELKSISELNKEIYDKYKSMHGGKNITGNMSDFINNQTISNTTDNNSTERTERFQLSANFTNGNKNTPLQIQNIMARNSDMGNNKNYPNQLKKTNFNSKQLEVKNIPQSIGNPLETKKNPEIITKQDETKKENSKTKTVKKHDSKPNVTVKKVDTKPNEIKKEDSKTQTVKKVDSKPNETKKEDTKEHPAKNNESQSRSYSKTASLPKLEKKSSHLKKTTTQQSKTKSNNSSSKLQTKSSPKKPDASTSIKEENQKPQKQEEKQTIKIIKIKRKKKKTPKKNLGNFESKNQTFYNQNNNTNLSDSSNLTNTTKSISDLESVKLNKNIQAQVINEIPEKMTNQTITAIKYPIDENSNYKNNSKPVKNDHRIYRQVQNLNNINSFDYNLTPKNKFIYTINSSNIHKTFSLKSPKNKNIKFYKSNFCGTMRADDCLKRCSMKGGMSMCLRHARVSYITRSGVPVNKIRQMVCICNDKINQYQLLV